MLGKGRQMQIDETNAQPCSEPAQDGTSSPEEPAWAQRNEPMERGQLLHQITSFSHRQHQVGDRQQAQRNEPGRGDEDILQRGLCTPAIFPPVKVAAAPGSRSSLPPLCGEPCVGKGASPP